MAQVDKVIAQRAALFLLLAYSLIEVRAESTTHTSVLSSSLCSTSPCPAISEAHKYHPHLSRTTFLGGSVTPHGPRTRVELLYPATTMERLPSSPSNLRLESSPRREGPIKPYRVSVPLATHLESSRNKAIDLLARCVQLPMPFDY